MKTIDRLYKDFRPLYPIEDFCTPDKALFIDIETTGLQKESTSLYLIGCGFYTAEGFMTRLFFADCEAEEYDILLEFSHFIKDYSHLFHFNGYKFDIPYLLYKAEKYSIDCLFDGIGQIDIYKLCKPLRYLLFCDSMKQKSIESFLGIQRRDRYNGGELIDVYRDYTVSRSEDALEALITHNREDVLGMHLIMPILYYLGFRDASLEFEGYRINVYKDFNDVRREEVIFEYRTSLVFPVSFSAKTETMYLKASADSRKISIRLPIYEDEMKVFFDNYRDYCYIPDEDTAMLRSLALSLPKGSYKKATRETCYRKVSGKFVKQPCRIFTPAVKTSLKDKRLFFRFPDSFKKEAAEQFGRELINIFFTMKRK